MATPQAEIAAARRFVTASTLVRYEDLVAAPAPTIRTAMAALGLPVDADALTAVNGRTVDLPVSHGLSGNPSRFRAGLQQLRLDEQWRRDMSQFDRLTTTAVASIPLGRYHYFRAVPALRSAGAGDDVEGVEGVDGRAPAVAGRVRGDPDPQPS